MTKTRLVALVEDEKDIAELVAYNLGKSGYETRTYSDGDSFLFALKNAKPDVVILDLMLPGTDGLSVCRAMKADPALSSIPIIMLTARASEADRVVGLELGADDYVVKPFSPRELVARVGAVLRRAESKLAHQDVIRVGELVIDPNQAAATLKRESLDLTATELKILTLLAGHPDRVFSRDQIIEQVWGYDKPVVDRTIDVHIMNLRAKLGRFGDRIVSLRGLGYKLTSG